VSELNLSVKHHLTPDEACRKLEETVREAQARFGAMIHTVEWSPDRSAVSLSGTGFSGRVWVDAQEAHAVVDVPILGRLLASPLVTGLKGMLENKFQKQLPG
jgi:hypothetical protein